MDVVLQRHCAKYIYAVPEGLRELMSDISREVLRSQPEDLCTFIADYLDALMITRENARVAARLVQTITEASETIIELLTRTNMDREQADQVAKVIQRAFRKHLEEQAQHEEIVDESTIIKAIIEEAGITKSQGDMAACIIQNAFRQLQERKDREKQMGLGFLDWRAAARSAIMLYRRTGVAPVEANRAAALIQAAYKGYYTRKLKKILLERHRKLEEGISDEEVISKAGDKKVRIDYSSIIPHVDFDEPFEDSTFLIVQDTIEYILRQVIGEDQFEEMEELEGEYSEDKFDEITEERQSLERFITTLLMDQLSTTPNEEETEMEQIRKDEENNGEVTDEELLPSALIVPDEPITMEHGGPNRSISGNGSGTDGEISDTEPFETDRTTDTEFTETTTVTTTDNETSEITE